MALLLGKDRSMRRGILAVALVCISVLCTGCSSSSAPNSDDTMKMALQDFAQFLEALPGDNIKPPKKLAEFIPLEPMAPVASEYLQNGKLVYFWGTGLNKSGNKIIAYEKDVETESGWVLLEDGTVQKMTSAVFSSAPKAS